jgi:hypothetical protein
MKFNLERQLQNSKKGVTHAKARGPAAMEKLDSRFRGKDNPPTFASGSRVNFLPCKKEVILERSLQNGRKAKKKIGPFKTCILVKPRCMF